MFCLQMFIVGGYALRLSGDEYRQDEVSRSIVLYYPPILKNRWDHNQKIFNTAKNYMILPSPYVMWICHVCGSRKRSRFLCFMCTWAPANGSNLAACCKLQLTARFMTLHPGRLNMVPENGGISVVDYKTFKLLIIQSFASQGLRRKSLMIFGYLWIFSYSNKGVFIRRPTYVYEAAKSRTQEVLAVHWEKSHLLLHSVI